MTVKRIGGQSNLSRIPREQLEAQHMALLGQLGEARMRFSALNATVCALLKEKHGGRAFVSIPTFAETQGWTLDIMPQKMLGNIRMIAVDANGHPQIADDREMAPTDVACCFEACGAPSTFCEGVEDGQPVNPRCSAHLPENAILSTGKVIVPDVGAEPEITACDECGRKGLHWPHCSQFDKSAN